LQESGAVEAAGINPAHVGGGKTTTTVRRDEHVRDDDVHRLHVQPMRGLK
jgi:hypothetical protein